MKKECASCGKKIGMFERHYRYDEVRGNDYVATIRKTKSHHCAACGDAIEEEKTKKR